MMAPHIFRITVSSIGRACGSTIPTIPHTVRSLLSSPSRLLKNQFIATKTRRHEDTKQHKAQTDAFTVLVRLRVFVSWWRSPFFSDSKGSAGQRRCLSVLPALERAGPHVPDVNGARCLAWRFA